MTQEEFQHIAPGIPQQPGIYKYYSAGNELIYVGKAKNIRKRVSSYFNKTQSSFKTHELVRRIHRIEFTIVNSEQDAFLLENSLIKEFQPTFNINLKDDKIGQGEGFIALQIHDGGGIKVRWKNFTIRELK